MRTLTIQLADDGRTAELMYGRVGSAPRMHRHEFVHPVQWRDFLGEVCRLLDLDLTVPPGTAIQSTTVQIGCGPWHPVHFQSIRMHGFGWGFWLPCGTETCCGFLNHAAAEKAARLLRNLEAVITGDLPNGTFEIFHVPDGAAFFDLKGELHSTFPTIREARGCAAKLEALQMHQATPEPSIPI